MRTTTCALLVVAAAAVGCRTSDPQEDQFLSSADETDLITPAEASARAQTEITPANVDAQLETLRAELEADGGSSK